MTDLEGNTKDVWESPSSSPAAPARLRARIMASGYRYHMIDGKEGLDLEFKEEAKNNKRETYLKGISVLLGLVALALLVALVFVVARQSTDTSPTPLQVCVTPECVKTSAGILSRMDHEVPPCKDMYNLACGAWLKNTVTPPGASKWSVFHEVAEDNQAKLRKLVEIKGTLLGGVNSTAVHKLKIWYRSCMDLEAIEDQGTTMLIETIAEAGFWTISPPVTGQPAWNADSWSLQDALLKSHRLGGSSLFSFDISKDPGVKNKNIIMFTQSGLTLAYPDEYKDPSYKFKSAFMSFAVTLGTLLDGDASDVTNKMAQVYEFEKNISQIFIPKEEMHDPFKVYNKFSLKDFQEKLGDWVDIKRFLKDSFYGREFNDSTKVIVATPDYFSQLGDLVKATDKEVLANYIVWNLVQTMVSYLPENFLRAAFELTKAETGMKTLPERWKLCLGQAKGGVGYAGSALFVENYFSQESKAKVESALEQVRQQFMGNLDSVTWLDDTTRAKLKIKAEAVSLMVGYPDWMMDAEKLDLRYEKLQVVKGDIFVSHLNSLSFAYNQSLEKYDKEPDSKEWEMLPDIVNAYYHPGHNQIVVPAGILQPPFYSPHYPDALLYGTIGTVIGHELTHGFDDYGHLFDENGMLNNIWTTHAEQGFKTATVCMENQYSDYSAYGHNVNGNLTLGENIADNGGVRLAYKAFLNSGNLSPTGLPGLNFTDSQLFFLGFSQLWCSIESPESLVLAIHTDPHSPGQFRVKGVLSNSLEFSQAFGCELDSPLNPADKCSVW